MPRSVAACVVITGLLAALMPWAALAYGWVNGEAWYHDHRLEYPADGQPPAAIRPAPSNTAVTGRGAAAMPNPLGRAGDDADAGPLCEPRPRLDQRAGATCGPPEPRR
jgi:hypothetical protein